MKKSLLFTLIFYTTLGICQTPNPQVDSLLKILSLTKTDTAKLRLYEVVFRKLQGSNPNKALLYADTITFLAKKLNDKNKEAWSLTLKSSVYIFKSDFDQAKKYAKEAISLALKINDYKVSMNSNNILGYIESDLGNLDGANSFYQESLKCAYIIKDSVAAARISSNIATNEKNKGDYEKALPYYFDALKILSANNLIHDKAIVLNNIGSTYSSIKDNEKCLQYAMQSADILRKEKDDFYLLISLNDAGTALVALKRYDEAEKVFLEAQKLNNIDNKKDILHSFEGLASVYASTDRLDKALAFYEKALVIGKEQGLKLDMHNLYQGIGNVLSKKGLYLQARVKYQEAIKIAKEIKAKEAIVNSERDYIANELLISNPSVYQVFQEYLGLRDSLYSKEKGKYVYELETKYQTAEKEKAIAEQNLQILSQKSTVQNQRYFLGISVLTLALLGFGLYSNGKKRKLEQQHNQVLTKKNQEIELNRQEIAQKKEETELLNREINHRVGNNLQLMLGLMQLQSRRMTSVEGKKALKENESRIHAMAILHDKLQAQNGVSRIDLKDYLQELSDGLRVAHSDESKKLAIDVDANTIVSNAHFAMHLGLIVNELVINSIKHAFAKQSNPSIDIQLREDDKKIYMTYQDNGQGLPEQMDISKSQSLGIKLIYSITKQLFGQVKTENQNGVLYQFDFQKTV